MKVVVGQFGYFTLFSKGWTAPLKAHCFFLTCDHEGAIYCAKRRLCSMTVTSGGGSDSRSAQTVDARVVCISAGPSYFAVISFCGFVYLPASLSAVWGCNWSAKVTAPLWCSLCLVLDFLPRTSALTLHTGQEEHVNWDPHRPIPQGRVQIVSIDQNKRNLNLKNC